MIAIVTVRANSASELETAALSKAASLWDCHLDRHTWYLTGSYAWKLAVLTIEPEARSVNVEAFGLPGQWEATFRVGMVRA